MSLSNQPSQSSQLPKLNEGGLGEIYRVENAYRVLKGNKIDYLEKSVCLFKDYMLRRFPELVPLQRTDMLLKDGSKVLFRIPANTLEKVQVESMLNRCWIS